jgi:hypothetical protein
MKVKLILLGSLLILPAVLIGWGDKAMDFQITTSGIDELGIEVRAPYGTRSLQHALLINNGPHYVLACELVFEVTTEDGKVLSTRRNVYSGSLLERDQVRGTAILDEEEKITPHSSWLLGFGEPGMERVENAPPALTEERISPEVFPGVKKCRKLSIRISGVITEDGKAHGPAVQEFLKHMDEDLRELKEAS